MKSKAESSTSAIPQANRELGLRRALGHWHERSGSPARHFLNLADIGPDGVRTVVDQGFRSKTLTVRPAPAAKGRSGVLLFQKTSTRTRCSFEVALGDLGLGSCFIPWSQSNFTLGAVEDEARVLSRYYDVIIARVNKHETLVELAAGSEVPVINGLSDYSHPCQALSDLVTIKEFFGQVQGVRITYVGDSNNVCRSLLEASVLAGCHLTICSPTGYTLPADELLAAGASVSSVADPVDAVKNADIIYTDTWVSMGQEADTEVRKVAFKNYSVDAKLVAAAPSHALVMHCLPAHPGLEIDAETLRGPRSIVFEQADNRRHAQRALLEYLL